MRFCFSMAFGFLRRFGTVGSMNQFVRGALNREAAVNRTSAVRPAGEVGQLWGDVCSWVCAIEDGLGKIGTGILIGADLVLTNHHVVENLFLAPARIKDAGVRFDFFEDIAFKGKVYEGRRVKLVENWSLDLPHCSDIDYAVIRLAEKVGDQAIADKNDRLAPQRSWLALPMATAKLVPGAEIRVLQHPVNDTQTAAQPRKESPGTILKLLHGGTVLRHDATTFGGSSGGAVLNARFNLIAIHQGGNEAEKFNQAIAISAITADIEKKGFPQLVGVAPPERRQPVARPFNRKSETEKARSEVTAWTSEVWQLHMRMLMDRDQEESDISAMRDMALEHPGLIHLIACRGVDSHANFLARLARLSLDKLGDEDRSKREAALLGDTGAQGLQPWKPARIEWPRRMYPAARAWPGLKTAVDRYLPPSQPTLVQIEIMMDQWEPVRDPELIAMLAAYLRGKEGVGADCLQVLVICADAVAQGDPDPYDADREKIRQIWDKDAPPGCGAAIEFFDVTSNDFGSWCQALAAAMTGSGGKIRGKAALADAIASKKREIAAAVGLALPGGQAVPMVVAEAALMKKLAPLIRKAAAKD
ncbi:serine protease [Mesorhizobium sp. M0478]|uniref:trypsin-like serine peptidase n=1 Tax=Mesorhizobium sp. M0478 TaxID=2956947 RepID=UPI00333931C5